MSEKARNTSEELIGGQPRISVKVDSLQELQLTMVDFLDYNISIESQTHMHFELGGDIHEILASKWFLESLVPILSRNQYIGVVGFSTADQEKDVVLAKVLDLLLQKNPHRNVYNTNTDDGVNNFFNDLDKAKKSFIVHSVEYSLHYFDRLIECFNDPSIFGFGEDEEV